MQKMCFTLQTSQALKRCEQRDSLQKAIFKDQIRNGAVGCLENQCFGYQTVGRQFLRQSRRHTRA